MEDRGQYSIPILELIKAAQQQNGLRHGDYQRYRQYCSRRLRRVRKSLKFTHGRGKEFIPKSVDVDTVQEVRHFYIPLYNAERAWSYAMQLREDEKNDKEENGEEGCNSRLKFHLAARLAKAFKWSLALLKICKELGDARTCLEAEAYAGYMQGNLALYREEWSVALGNFSTAKRIYEQLGKVGTLEQQDVVAQMMDEINPYIRYCEYNLKALGGEVQSTAWMHSESSFLQAKLELVLAETAKAQAKCQSSVTWCGTTIPVENETVLAAILRPGEHVTLLASVAVDAYEKRETIYLDVFRHYDAALRMLRQEQEKVTVMNKGTLVQGKLTTYKRLEEYVRYQKLTHLVARNIMLFAQMGGGAALSWNTFTTGNAATSVEDAIHLLDMILQNLQDMKTLPGLSDDVSALIDVQSRITTFSSLRCYYLAESLTVSEAYGQALALYERTLVQVQLASELNAKRAVAEEGKYDQVFITGLWVHTKGAKARCLAQSVLTDIAATEAVTAGVDALNLSASKEPTYLVQRLHQFDSGDPERRHSLVAWPPTLMATPAKPLFFDMADTELAFPEMVKTEPVASSGFFGWFR